MPDLDLTPLRSALAEFAAQGRAALLPALHAAQSIYGYLPEAVAAEVGRALGVPLADVHGVIDFYSMLYREPVGRTIVRVCADPACALRGADAVLDAACRKANVVMKGNTSADGAYTIERSTCLGLCNLPVAVNVSQSQRSLSFGQVRLDRKLLLPNPHFRSSLFDQRLGLAEKGLGLVVIGPAGILLECFTKASQRGAGL